MIYSNGIPLEVPIRGIASFDLVHIKGRLKSTRSGLNYNWSANQAARRLIGAAPYEPRIDLWLKDASVTWLGWHQPCDDVSRCPYKVAVSFGGSLVDAPATVVGDVAYSSRLSRLAAIEWAKGHQAREFARQGNLVVYEVRCDGNIGIDDNALFHNRPNGPVTLFNHAVFVEAATGLDNYRLVRAHIRSIITSPDHPLQPVGLGAGRTYLLEHPFPIQGRTD